MQYQVVAQHAYINGTLRRSILASNTDTYSFPIGNGTGTSTYQRVDMINGNLTGCKLY